MSMISCDRNKKDDTRPKILQLSSIKIGTIYLNLQGVNNDIPVDKNILIEFSNQLDTSSVQNNILLQDSNSGQMFYDISYLDEYKTVVLHPSENLDYFTDYSLHINEGLKGKAKETFGGVEYAFKTENKKMIIESITINEFDFNTLTPLHDIDRTNITIEITFSNELNEPSYSSFLTLSGSPSLVYDLTGDNKQVTISNVDPLDDYTKYYFTISKNLTSKEGYIFDGFSNSFYTNLDSSLKFPELTDEQLLDVIQKQTFRYFWDFAHPVCGLTRERNTSVDKVSTGGSGFGIMAIIIGMERGYITRQEGLARLDKILEFLETADRYHGAWPHWLNGATGKTIPFSTFDDGADLVETGFMVEGLLTMRQYLNSSDTNEKTLINRINDLKDAVEYDWFTRGEDVLYWHWSPNVGWKKNMEIRGYNETIITYILAAASTTHPVSADVYHKGYANSGSIVNGNTYYGYKLPLGPDYGGPLFFTHYSYLGLDPRNLEDMYANYWEQNVNHSLINWAYCNDNPHNYVGYNNVCWGLTASDNHISYNAHSPTNDLGVITPTAAVSALPYIPEKSMDAIRHFYYILGDRLWGEYGFYDAFNVTEGWWADSYIAIDQGPIICMIENYRTGLLWELFMSAPEVQNSLDKLGFTY